MFHPPRIRQSAPVKRDAKAQHDAAIPGRTGRTCGMLLVLRQQCLSNAVSLPQADGPPQWMRLVQARKTAFRPALLMTPLSTCQLMASSPYCPLLKLAYSSATQSPLIFSEDANAHCCKTLSTGKGRRGEVIERKRSRLPQSDWDVSGVFGKRHRILWAAQPRLTGASRHALKPGGMRAP